MITNDDHGGGGFSYTADMSRTFTGDLQGILPTVNFFQEFFLEEVKTLGVNYCMDYCNCCHRGKLSCSSYLLLVQLQIYSLCFTAVRAGF